MFLVGLLKRPIGQNSNFSVPYVSIGSFTDITEKFPAFLNKLSDIATKCVPKLTAQSIGIYKQWFKSECKKAVKGHQNTMDKCRANPTSDNINEYKNCQANGCKVTKESKRNVMA